MLRLLGTPAVEINGRQTTAGLPKRFFVLATLLRLSHANVGRREALASSLWEESDTGRASASLRHLVLATHKWETANATALFGVSHEEIFRNESHLASDLDEFLALREVRTGEALERLLFLYRGDLLADMPEVAPSLDQWLTIQRSRLRERFATLAMEGAERTGGVVAETALDRLASELPYDDAVCRARMRHFARSRSVASAIADFHDFERRLREDLQTAPDGETTALARQLARDQGLPPQTRTPLNPFVPAVPSSLVATRNEYARQLSGSAVPRILILMPSGELAQAGHHARQLGAALVDDMTLGLCRMRSFAVIAPHSAAQIVPAGARQASLLHQIDYVVETQLRQNAAGTARLDIKLVRSETAEVLWGETFPLSADGRPEGLEDLSRRLATIVAASVERAEMRSLNTQTPLGAYKHYLMGRHCLKTVSLENVRRARKWFHLAMNLDPEFAPACSWLAHCLILEWMVFSHSGPELLNKASDLAKQAIDIDPIDGNGYRELGRAALFLGQLDESLDLFVTAEKYVPHHADMLADYADTLMHNSDPVAAKRRIDQALTLNPLAPDVYRWIAGGISFFAGEPRAALDHLERMRKPDQALKLMAASAAMAGELDQAKLYRHQALAHDPDFNIRKWTTRLPVRNPEHLDMYRGALRAAGFV